jgi:GNAT superfamily N-acetyltransferase
MEIIDIPPAGAARLVPLLEDLHAIHVAGQPGRHRADPPAAELEGWLADWLKDPDVHALAAESPTGALLGYLIYAVEERPALPVRDAETRLMLHHVAVQEAWRRMGVAKALMEAMKARADRDGIRVITATYAPFNAASAGLMASQGLEPVLTVAERRC